MVISGLFVGKIEVEEVKLDLGDLLVLQGRKMRYLHLFFIANPSEKYSLITKEVFKRKNLPKRTKKQNEKNSKKFQEVNLLHDKHKLQLMLF